VPKQKTRRGAAKRFKLTATGKLKHKKAYLRHILSTKSPKTKRNLRHATTVNQADEKRIKRLVPYL